METMIRTDLKTEIVSNSVSLKYISSAITENEVECNKLFYESLHRWFLEKLCCTSSDLPNAFPDITITYFVNMENGGLHFTVCFDGFGDSYSDDKLPETLRLNLVRYVTNHISENSYKRMSAEEFARIICNNPYNTSYVFQILETNEEEEEDREELWCYAQNICPYRLLDRNTTLLVGVIDYHGGSAYQVWDSDDDKPSEEYVAESLRDFATGEMAQYSNAVKSPTFLVDMAFVSPQNEWLES